MTTSIASPGGGHSLVLRLAAPPGPADEERLLAHLAARTGAPRRVWHQHTGRRRGDPRVAALVERELARELREGSPLRVTFVHYAVGGTDAVFVADRAVVDRAALLAMADALRGAAAARPTGIADPGQRPPVRVADAPEWGLPRVSTPAPGSLGGAFTVTFPPGDGPSRNVLLAALALTTARYEGASATRIALEGEICLQLEIDESVHVAEFCQGVATSLAGVQATSSAFDDGPAAIALWCDEDSPELGYLPYQRPHFPLALRAVFRGDRASAATCRYRASAVSPAMARAFCRHLTHVAAQLADPAVAQRPLSAVELMTPREVAAVLAAGATRAPTADRVGTIHRAFREVAGRFPNRPAVCDQRRVLTYHELEHEAERRALSLVSLGVRPGDFVGVCLDRTADLVVTLLAVLMAGAAYVPLDPHNPADRLRFIAEDAGLGLVVADDGCFPDGGAAKLVTPADLALRGPLAEFGGSREPGTGPDCPAYVIYTSGSTGRPKGVVVPHRNVPALIAAAAQAGLGLDERDVWTLFHSSSFDFSVWEIWGCLLTGGRLVVVPHLTARSPAEFHRLLAAERVTVLSQTPSAFANLLEADAAAADSSGAADGGPGPRLVVFGGEPLDVGLLGGWFARHPASECRMVNMFGITETTVHVTARTVLPADVRTRSRSVGRALPGWSVSVRDASGRLVPPGVPGEIYVGGAGVADGYHGRPELTAQRFLDDPLGSGRVYRSGDRGRMHPDGSLDHLGRLDGQVKIRGFRIELDEIRAVLLDDPAVEAAAVTTVRPTEDPTDVRIAAYVILRAGSGGNGGSGGGHEAPEAVRRRAARLLPDYMVPASITELTEIPLTANGKLDKARLPAPGAATASASPGTSVDAAPSAGATAQTVRRLWQRILATPAGIDTDADFFECGGNSLLAVRLLTALAESGLPRLAVRDLYRNRTAAQLTALLEARCAASSGSMIG